MATVIFYNFILLSSTFFACLFCNASDKLIDSTSVLMSGLVKINEIKSLDFRNLELEKEKSLFFLKDYL